jgi:hypothetical protein
MIKVSAGIWEALDALVLGYKGGQRAEKKETFCADINPLSKHLVLGTVISRCCGAKQV